MFVVGFKSDKRVDRSSQPKLVASIATLSSSSAFFGGWLSGCNIDQAREESSSADSRGRFGESRLGGGFESGKSRFFVGLANDKECVNEQEVENGGDEFIILWHLVVLEQTRKLVKGPLSSFLDTAIVGPKCQLDQLVWKHPLTHSFPRLQ